MKFPYVSFFRKWKAIFPKISKECIIDQQYFIDKKDHCVTKSIQILPFNLIIRNLKPKVSLCITLFLQQQKILIKKKHMNAFMCCIYTQ